MSTPDELKKQIAELEHKLAIRNAQGEMMTDEIERSKREVAATNAETARLNEQTAMTKRDNALRMALNEVPCLERDFAFKIFQNNVQLNAAGEHVYVEPKTGKHLPLREGLAANMPDYVAPATNRGGSGTVGGCTRTPSVRDREIQREKDKLQQLKQRYAQTGGSSVVLNQLTKQLRIIKVLEELKQRRRR